MRTEQGFTLVEVMVALALTTVLLSVIYSSLWVGLNSTQRISGTITENDSERTLTYFVRSQLRQLDTRFDKGFVPIRGDVKSLQFRVRHLRGDPALRTFDIELLRNEETGMVLGIRESEGPGNALSHGAVLMDGLSSLAFDYYGALDQATAAAWHDAWDSDDRLPQMVRMSYRRHSGPERELYLAVAGPAVHSTGNGTR